MAVEDDFEIDIYGDGEDFQQNEVQNQGVGIEDKPVDTSTTNGNISHSPPIPDQPLQPPPPVTNGSLDIKTEGEESQDRAQKITSTDDSAQNPVYLPKQAPQTQGLRRQDGADERYVEPGATTALFISELHWWVTDDDIRGWANQSECEDELVDMTFSEHKVNGKSKGQAYVLFKSPQAATAAKQKIESFGEGQQYTKKFTVSYTNPFTNPFRTLPKDIPMRNPNGDRASGFRGGAGNNSHSSGYHSNSGGGYRGNRGGGYNRGGINGTSNYNRGGFQQPVTGGFQGSPMAGFQGMGGTQPYGGFQNRGGMMGGMRGGSVGMRGGRGGMGANGIMTMPMGGMGMGNMGAQMGALGMGMPQMGAGMGMQGMQSFQVPPPATGSGSSPYAGALIPSPGFDVYTTSSPTTMPGTRTNSMGYSQYPASGSPTYQTSYHSNVSPNASEASQFQQNRTLTASPSDAGQGGYHGNAHYNPAFFPQPPGQPSIGAGDNPHGLKRTRQE